MGTRRARTISVLSADRDLAERLAPAELEAARPHAVAPVVTVRPGAVDPKKWMRNNGGELGLLIVSGVLTRSVTVLGRTSIELLGPGDLVRPAEEGAGGVSVPREVHWSALQPAQIAILDQGFAWRVARWPEIGAGLLDRMFRRVQRLSFHIAILENPHVDVRLVLLFWQLADRWGHVGPDGVTVPLRLTHQALGRLIRAQRPSVTASLRGLAERGLIERDDANFWLLRGDVSEHLTALSSALPTRLPDPG